MLFCWRVLKFTTGLNLQISESPSPPPAKKRVPQLLPKKPRPPRPVPQAPSKKRNRRERSVLKLIHLLQCIKCRLAREHFLTKICLA